MYYVDFEIMSDADTSWAKERFLRSRAPCQHFNRFAELPGDARWSGFLSELAVHRWLDGCEIEHEWTRPEDGNPDVPVLDAQTVNGREL